MKLFYTSCLFLLVTSARAQPSDTIQNPLENLTIRAFEQSRQLKEVPAAVVFLNRQGIERFGTSSIVQAVNTLAGVRMEERSPGSYRFNIRGSSLRSPFGVRNVKVYYNDLPFTDPGGHTYLNGLGFYNFHSLEIVKGPGSSLYGAGTGGVLLIEGMNTNEQPNVLAEFGTGSFGLRNLFASVTTGSGNSKNKIGYQHQESEGFRYHSALQRHVLSWNGRFGDAETGLLKTTFLYSDLFYETPGALTRQEYLTDPKLSRPAGGGFPGAEQARASIGQKTFLAGFSYHHRFHSSLSNTTSVYGMFTELRNPTIRNYGKNNEPHAGGRTSFRFQSNGLSFIAGAEYQQGFTTLSVHQNNQGNPDTLQSLDDIATRQALAFLQASYEQWGWEITAGGSLNFLYVQIKQTSPLPFPEQVRNFSNEFAPRVSLAKKWQNVTVYSSIAWGFSPPTSTELLPSGSRINLDLRAEQGINYDIGARGKIHRLIFDVNAFLFSLQNTIVQRRDAGGGDFFVNAGNTRQYGMETSLSYPLTGLQPLSTQSRFWLSHSFHSFRYKDFKQLNNDFSGKRLPGVAPHTLAAGLDLAGQRGWLANVSYYFSDRHPLNDANTEYADLYHLLHAKLGYEWRMAQSWRTKLVVGAENLLNQTYSLGNDINGFGGRFFNAAPGRSFYASLTMQLTTQKN